MTLNATGSKQNIDDDTPIELSCDTPNTTIFYTINGEKPVPFDTKSRWTYTYTGIALYDFILNFYRNVNGIYDLDLGKHSMLMVL